MGEIVLLVGSLLILSSIIFFVLSPNVGPNYLLPYWSASTLVLASGVLFILKAKDRKVSVFVCGQCERKFLTEIDLRKHYATEHVQKDSDEKKD
jgi:hypothetical protein